MTSSCRLLLAFGLLTLLVASPALAAEPEAQPSTVPDFVVESWDAEAFDGRLCIANRQRATSVCADPDSPILMEAFIALDPAQPPEVGRLDVKVEGAIWTARISEYQKEHGLLVLSLRPVIDVVVDAGERVTCLRVDGLEGHAPLGMAWSWVAPATSSR